MKNGQLKLGYDVRRMQQQMSVSGRTHSTALQLAVLVVLVVCRAAPRESLYYGLSIRFASTSAYSSSAAVPAGVRV